jgi:stage IV sporulation protein FB
MRIGRIFDIDIHISEVLVLLLAVLLITGRSGNVTAVFFIFLVHEAAHVIAARLLNLKVNEIELLPFGGAVKIQSFFESRPIHEIVVAAAGPLSNVLLLLLYFGGIQVGWLSHGMPDSDFVNINLILAGFNLLPALPLDGGRILRALLSRQIGLERATRIASGMGILLAAGLTTAGLYGLYYRVIHYSLFILSGFLIYSAVKRKKCDLCNA